MKWSMFAGGTGAASGKHGYDTRGTFGEYNIQPICSRHGLHLGYRLHFLNTKGKLRGGLWQELGIFRSPNEAKGAAKKHYQHYFAGSPGRGKANTKGTRR